MRNDRPGIAPALTVASGLPGAGELFQGGVLRSKGWKTVLAMAASLAAQAASPLQPQSRMQILWLISLNQFMRFSLLLG